MRNLLLIARREYLERIRGRAFRASTVLVPLLMVAMLVFGSLTGRRIGTGKHVGIAADNAVLADDVRAQLVADKRANYRVDAVAPATPHDRDRMLAEVRDKSLDGLLTIEDSASPTPQATFASQSSADLLDTERLTSALNHGLVHLRLMRQGVPASEADALLKDVNIEMLQIESDGKTGQSRGMEPVYKAVMMCFLITMPILLYGMDMARSIVEEKSSRVFEVMLSSVRAEEMLAGKLLGVCAVGMTQIAIWSVAAAALTGSALLAPLISGDIKLHFSLIEAVFFPIYFVLGFLLYSAFFSGLAATCETAQDLQMYISLAIVPTWLSFGMLPVLLNNPNSRWVAALSMFPPTAPLVMTPRLGLLLAPFPYWQLALSVGLLALSIWAVIWFAARLYRVGVLMYGKRATLPELLRWLRYS